jgi:hypothetical protein
MELLTFARQRSSFASEHIKAAISSQTLFKESELFARIGHQEFPMHRVCKPAGFEV